MTKPVAQYPITPPQHLERFVARSNIKRFQHMLQETRDAADQRVIEELLAEEFVKLRQAESQENQAAI
jgi:hypothetical protein